jgi:hypothetical protein
VYGVSRTVDTGQPALLANENGQAGNLTFPPGQPPPDLTRSDPVDRIDQQPQPPTPAPWPHDVIAAYLTDAGRALANPNLAAQVHAYQRTGQQAKVSCTVCPWTHTAYGNPGMTDGWTDEYCESRATEGAHASARAHAEKCRALPKPTAAQ